MTKREFDWKKVLILQRPSLKDGGILFVIAISFGLLGPFGTFEAGLMKSLLYWMLMCFVGYLIYWPILSLATVYAEERGRNIFGFFSSAVLLASLPMTLLVSGANHIFFNLRIDDPMVFVGYYPFVVVIGGLVGGVSFLHSKWKEKNSLLEKVPPIDPGRDFLNRLPLGLGQKLICFSTEDHYLRVYTDKGDHLLLHRLKDALTELLDYDGMQVHRSWWVAAKEVTETKREGRKIILTMSNGLEIPVSRTYQANVKERFGK